MKNKTDIKYYIKHLKEIKEQTLLFGTMNELRSKWGGTKAELAHMTVNDYVMQVITYGTMDIDFEEMGGYVITMFTHRNVTVYTAHNQGEIRFIIGL